jgi:two-component system cell cycle sensor histidine kinase/response regulator CckA
MKKTVLLIEDDEVDAELVRRFLNKESENFKIVHKTNFTEAKTCLAEGNFFAILLDLNLPDREGLDSINELIYLPVDSPIIVLTGQNDRATALKAIDSGADDYLVKEEITASALLKSLEYSHNRYQLKVKLLNSQDQLKQAQKMQAIGTLASGIAHDFNNLLAVIMGYAGLLAEIKSDNPNHATSVSKIMEASEQARDLTEQLLTYSKGNSSVPETFNASPLIKEMSAFFDGIASTHEFIVQISDNEELNINFNKIEFQQVIMNLVLNANDALEKRGRISITAEKIDIEENMKTDTGYLIKGLYMKLSVSDNGKGMSPETKTRIFEPFFSTKELDSNKGTGLGLAIIYTVCKQSRSFVNVSSQVDQGTSFDIFIPLVNEPAPQATV